MLFDIELTFYSLRTKLIVATVETSVKEKNLAYSGYCALKRIYSMRVSSKVNKRGKIVDNRYLEHKYKSSDISRERKREVEREREA